MSCLTPDSSVTFHSAIAPNSRPVQKHQSQFLEGSDKKITIPVESTNYLFLKKLFNNKCLE
ncbi:MAG: hypothetical protein H6Q48_1200 [Deltaproteobacteria bacterium]|nr:hypothetical protein [Deltaproteobacteria bacterium]MBP1738907.1 hypothetical protein [Deltaproteobacteria bacterium]